MSQPQSCSVSRHLELPDLEATCALARQVAAAVRPGDVIALRGDLGSGKTAFARALIGALADPARGAEEAGPGEEVPSPTFTLVQTYRRLPAEVWHFDLYRLERPDEVYELGIEDALAEGISLIEWPERLGPLLPRERLDLLLSFGAAPGARRAEIRGHGGWAERLKRLDLEDRASAGVAS